MLLALRAICFVFLLPGTIGAYVPYRILRVTGHWVLPEPSLVSFCAGAVTLLGAGVLLRCVRDFFAAGGTLAPVDPPKQLVVRGLYRYTRNPMYDGVLAVILGEAWLFRSSALLAYAVLVWVAFHLFVVLYEERALESAFGDTYRAYCKSVPRWGFSRADGRA
jgi:protein-S-isoprenylcysteine O-methyltransferase Ste14